MTNPFQDEAAEVFELLSHLLEAGRRGGIVILGGLAVDHNASGREGRPQRQARGADERCLKSRCQVERELHSLFAVTLNVDVDQYGRNGHHLLPLIQPAAFSASCPRATVIGVDANPCNCRDLFQCSWIDLR